MKKTPRPNPQSATFLLDRREFLKLSGLGVTGALSPGLIGCVAEEPGPPLGTGVLGRGFVVTARRPQDFVALRFQFVGLRLDPTKSKLIKSGTGPHRVIAHFPSQHILEQALPENASTFPATVEALLSGPSRLVFNVPGNVTEIPFSLEALLQAVRTFGISVTANALPPNPNLPPLGGSSGLVIGPALKQKLSKTSLLALQRMSGGSGVSLGQVDPGAIQIGLNPGPPEEPGALETAIELPFRLILSPNNKAGFTHADGPVASSGRVELWHTRLGIFEQGTLHERASFYRTLRAVWTRDNDGLNQPAFLASLASFDREQLVVQTADFSKQPTPRPVDARQLMLSSLGGFLDSRGEWEDNRSISMWEHRAALARDNFVKVVYNGYCYPSGHRATVVKITERKLKRPDAPHTAYLYQRCFIVIKEPLKNYGSVGREVPFEWLHIKQLVSPVLDNCPNFTKPDPNQPAPPPEPFVPTVDGQPFRFPVEVLDRDGQVRRFDMPIVWIPLEDGTAKALKTYPGWTTDAVTEYNKTIAGQQVDTVDLAGQRYAFALSNEVDDTTFETESLRFIEASDGSGNQTPGFAPGMRSANVQVEAARSLGGNGGGVEVEYAPVYLQNGFSGNNAQGQVVLKATTPVDLSFSQNAKNSGGFLSPGMKITALSRKKGPIGGDPNNFAAGNFDASSFFDQIDAMLFGVIPLKTIIDSTGLDDAPTFITQALDAVGSVVRDVIQIKTLATELSVSFGTALTTLEQSGPSAFLNPNFLTDLINDFAALASAAAALPGGGEKDGEIRLFKRLVADLNSMLNDAAFQAAVQAFQAAQELAKNQTVRIEWRPKIKGDSAGFFEPLPPKQMLLSVEARGKDLPGKPAGVDLIAALPNFNLNLLGSSATFMVLEFDRIQFRVVNGKKPEIDVIFKNIGFDGILYFVQKLAEIIPLEGFSDPPNVDVSAEGLRAMFTLPLPNIAVGMFSLENIAISAGFHVPFLGPPVTVTFGFCSRENPFRLTVSMLGGGGFFGLTASPNGMELLEASLEFGASLSVDFGVASGSVSIMAGIYFAMGPSTAELTGYLRARGEVDVLGLITASIELYMSLTYQFASHKVIGKASIEIEVSVACFSATVTVEAERKFAGSNEDPTFVELMAPQGNYEPFTEYLQAFAA